MREPFASWAWKRLTLTFTIVLIWVGLAGSVALECSERLRRILDHGRR